MASRNQEIALPVKLFVTGGCRSGKSRFAEQWAGERFRRRMFLATMEDNGDEEMTRRIELHRKSRGPGWQTLEVAEDLVGALEKHQAGTDVMLVDCLTLWLTNLILRGLSDERIEARVMALCQTVREIKISVVLVANEVGLGIVPESSLGRRFRDLAGWTNQQAAVVCDQVVMIAAGLPLQLKG
jgi:adenosylcobinamide kinase/adenosylcobinamide-phosphate guanylyltransferase